MRDEEIIKIIKQAVPTATQEAFENNPKPLPGNVVQQYVASFFSEHMKDYPILQKEWYPLSDEKKKDLLARAVGDELYFPPEASTDPDEEAYPEEERLFRELEELEGDS
jgi:hypothetical protein